MRVVAVEEHFVRHDLVASLEAQRVTARGWPAAGRRPSAMAREAEMADLGEGRRHAMDEAGVTQQILSVSGPGADLMPFPESLALARAYNDGLSRLVADDPKRFAGLAHLPMAAPKAAADELERAVRTLDLRGALINGTTSGHFLDDPMFEPVLARAERLDVPLYLHPNVPPRSVVESYYDRLPGNSGFLLSTNAFGWHAETALHILRLVVSGTFDRHPGLKVVIGHMGETLPVMLARCDAILNADIAAPRGVSGTIRDQVWITTSGFFTIPPFLAALLTFGADRILFAVDYPYSSNEMAVKFLQSLPIPETDREKIAHVNADKLFKL